MINLEYEFDEVQTPWDLAVEQLSAGDTMSARRFLTLMEMSEDQSSEDAALELEQLGVMLDVADLPKLPGNPDTDVRLALEEKLFRQGGWESTLDKRDPLRLFLKEMESFAALRDEEALAAQAAAGDEKAMQALTGGYLRTVYETAGEFMGKGVLLLDLIQEGSLGLWQGILSYRTGAFRDHALWWIRQAMARVVTLQAQEGGIGAHLVEQIDAFQKADKKLLTVLGRNPTMAELAQELHVTLEEANSLAKTLREVREMAKIRDLEEKGPEAVAEEEAESETAVEDTAYYQTRERVDSLLSGLTEQETQLLNMRYGLDGRQPLSISEAAMKLGMTGEEIVAAEAAALAKMRRIGDK